MNLKTLLLVFSSLFVVSAAWAVPSQLAHQGRLLDVEGAALTGEHSLTFALFDAATEGNEVWSESVTVDIVGGFYNVVLGADETNNPLDDLILGSPPLWLELTVDGGEPLLPRHELVSVPYAVLAGTAENVEGGYVDASEVAVDGTTVIDGSGNWVGPTPAVDWSDLSGVPVGLDDGLDADTLAGLTCLDGARPRWDLGTGLWVCDQVAWSEILSIPADLADGDADTLGGLVACADGGVAKFNLGTGLWECGADLVLGSTEVLAYVDGSTIDLGILSSVNGASIATMADLDWSMLTGLPAGLADGVDADSLAGLTCGDGARPRWDLTSGLWALWVNPSSRLRGIGRQLLDAVLSWGQERGCEASRVNVSVAGAALPALQRLGVEPDGSIQFS